MFVGAVSDNFTERIDQKTFHCEIVVDAEKVKSEESRYEPIPIITNFIDDEGNDRMAEMIEDNYNQIKSDIREIVARELDRIAGDPDLSHLLPQKE